MNRALNDNHDLHPILKVENLVKQYSRRNLASKREGVLALAGISFAIMPRTTVAVIGESGSGKSTLGLCVASLESPTSGRIWFEGKDVGELSQNERRQLRSQIQLIFQDPANSLNPRWNSLELLIEPLVLQRKINRDEMKRHAHSLLEQVGLPPEILERSPMEMSGGQRQRLAIARALALDPKLVILDEALSALDCSVQAQIANLLMELQINLGISYLFITHDLAMAAHLASEILVLDRGMLVEQGTTEKILRQPHDETTRRLLQSTPRMIRPAHPVWER